MSQAGFTPIQLYFSTTAAATPSAGNLANGELAINITDGRLFYKDNGGVVRVLAGTGGSGVVAGSNTQVQFNNNGVFGASANMTFNGTRLTVADLADSGLTAGRVVYVGSGSALVDSSALTFDGTTLATTAAISTSNVSGYNVQVSGGNAYRMFATTNDLVFRSVTAGSDVMTLTFGGNVGIGTSSPGAKLDVTTDSTNDGGIFLTADGSSFGYASNITFRSKLTSGGSIGVAAKIRAELSSSNNAGLLFFTTASGTNAEKMRLDSSGNLGLGATPSAWGGLYKSIDITASASFVGSGGTSAFVANNAYNDGSTWRYKTSTSSIGTQLFGLNPNGSGGYAWFQAASGTAGNAISFTQAMTLDASGNLLVGTTSPSFNAGSRGNITVGGSGSAIFALQTGGTAKGYVFHDGTEMTIANEANGFLRFYTNATERARIDSSGNLLVGTTVNTLDGKLFVESTKGTQVAITHNASGGQVFFSNGVAAAGTGWRHFNGVSSNNTVQNIIIYGNGNVVNANNSYGPISDVKLKENIIDASPKLNKLLQVRIVNYNLKTDPDLKQIGVIAQELEQVFPGLVDEHADRDAEGNDLGTTTKSVKMSVFVPMLIKAIQEQQALIQTLTARVQALESN